jgi:hypothetical protein
MNKLSPASFGKILDNIEFQKAYLFKMILPKIELPEYVTNMTINDDAFTLCTSNTAFPVMTTAVHTINYYNSEWKIAKNTTFSTWNATFKLDLNRQVAGAEIIDLSTISFIGRTPTFNVNKKEGFNTYEYFYRWQRAIYDPIRRTSYLPNNYKYPIELQLLRENLDEKPAMMFKLIGAFPTQISNGSLDYSSDSVLTFNVEFAFDLYEVTNKEN